MGAPGSWPGPGRGACAGAREAPAGGSGPEAATACRAEPLSHSKHRPSRPGAVARWQRRASCSQRMQRPQNSSTDALRRPLAKLNRSRDPYAAALPRFKLLPRNRFQPQNLRCEVLEVGRTPTKYEDRAVGPTLVVAIEHDSAGIVDELNRKRTWKL